MTQKMTEVGLAVRWLYRFFVVLSTFSDVGKNTGTIFIGCTGVVAKRMGPFASELVYRVGMMCRIC